MQNANFIALLEECGTNRFKFARELKVAPSTVYRWGNNAPEYAMIILRIRAGVRRALKVAEQAGAEHIEKLRKEVD